jgi:hypothetical protein
MDPTSPVTLLHNTSGAGRDSDGATIEARRSRGVPNEAKRHECAEEKSRTKVVPDGDAAATGRMVTTGRGGDGGSKGRPGAKERQERYGRAGGMSDG